ncbi:winged helix-turn-helix transcriptional regulator [Bacillus sp. ISL-47]|uniref:carbohydrate kinase n=1 Tax=Bacillus sp. ISL-47 TaxID=2819130 RepID=UPI001BE505AC|nr:carbohydrate kinase [Bacillus sp. ISL-47]MBT2688462.1 winged helix-turn-helix transcriptional regulator [Bacillus sp. ISL-47]MBT2709075.1 winged helix-turn-helix transcriptional regulator [Pseudomonas sp. ISL-84]
MNDKELLILQLIKENPFIVQNELAEKTGLSRSAVAGYISSLTKQGKILGRAYVLPERKEVLCIGGANVDRKIQTTGQLQYETSNPAESSQSSGGVARNIAENLGRLGCDVGLMTVVGDDPEGGWLLEYTKAFADITPSQSLPGFTTGTYTAVLGHDGEMAVALADMTIYENVTKDFVEKKWGYLASSEMVILDTNYPPEVLKQIIARCYEENIPLCITPVSAPKIKNLPKNLNGVTWLIANKDEAEALTGMKISSEGDFFKAAEKIMKKGVEKVVISRGDKGLIYYTNEGEAGVLLAPKVNVAEVTGAGDSLVSGVIFGHLKGLGTEDACKIGMTCSMLALQSLETVNPNLNNTRLQETFKKYFN